MCWTRSKLGIVNLSHATQVYPWEPKPGVHEVRAVFPENDVTLSEHASRAAAEAMVESILARLSPPETWYAKAAPVYPWTRPCVGIHSPYSGQCEHCQPPSPQDLAEMDAPDDKEPSFVTEDRNGKLRFDDAADKEWRESQASK